MKCPVSKCKLWTKSGGEVRDIPRNMGRKQTRVLFQFKTSAQSFLVLSPEETNSFNLGCN